MRGALLHAHLLHRMFVIDVAGALVAEEPPAAGDVVVDEATLGEALAAGRPVVSNLFEGSGQPRILMFVPIRDWHGSVAGLVGGELDPRAKSFADILRPFRRSPGGSVELVDGRGVVLATTEPNRQYAAGALDTGAAPPEGVAVARLSAAPWRVVVRERGSESTAVLSSFTQRVLVLIPLLIGLGALFAWGTARSLTRPLVALTRAAERIRRGDLDQAMPRLGPDEIGRLGEALEAMRVALTQSIESVALANEQLERRVEERTRELEAVTRELRQRDEARGWLLKKVISAQEDERKRLARDLHDETSQTLSALAMHLETAWAAAQSETTRARLSDARTLTRRAIDELHRLMHDLRPSVLDDLGLLPAIRWYAERYLKPAGISVRCECADVDERFRPEFEIAVFRVVQEAITNIVKHAGAETVLIECEPSGGDLVIDIEDDGAGFDPGEVATSPDTQRGLGLLGMRERVELLGGSVKVDSAPGRGTHVSVRVPLPQEVARA
jgi:signal transduction histidine kinase